MDLLGFSDSSYSSLTTFVRKIKHASRNFAIPDEYDNVIRNNPFIKNQPDDDLFGNVRREEFNIILRTYDDNKKKGGCLEDEPIKCDKLKGKSFAKLLHSKPGFHHPGSTAILVSRLGINDKFMDSLLGGHSTYSISRGDDISSLRNRYKAAIIRTLAKRLQFLLTKGDTHSALLELDRIFNINERDPNYLACRGMIASKRKKYDDAVHDLKDALEGEVVNKDEIKAELIHCLNEIGTARYAIKRYEQALESFREVLKLDATNGYAQTHIRSVEVAVRASRGSIRDSYRK